MKMMAKIARVFITVFVVNNATAALDANNDPRFIVPGAVATFETLPTRGELTQDKTPWASSFWPHVYGGIAYRWNDFYKEKPFFASMHNRVDEINEEIEELQKELFVQENSAPRNQEIIREVERLKAKKRQINYEKSNYYKRDFFDITRPQKVADVRLMSQEDIDRLSPAEKYDVYVYLLTGKDNGFKLTKDVLGFTAPNDAYWEGVCHGWSSAALEFKEPRPLSISKRGITLNLGSSDLKALLSYYHAAMTRNWVTAKKSNTGRVGERCSVAFSKEAWLLKDGVEYYKTIVGGKVQLNKVPQDCVATDPGAFHVVLANMIALKNQGFVAEVVRDSEVWNQPVYKYETKKITETKNISKQAARGTFKQVEVKTRMHYANDGGRMFWINDGTDDEFYAWWSQTTGTSNYRHDSKEFHYILDLDRRGNIIGGQWLSYERPDFLWLKKSKGFIGSGMFYGIVNYLDDLKNLVELQD
ncbi:MAG: hypothetical protein WD025_01665 [Bacteriovoracaceae bacterium]